MYLILISFFKKTPKSHQTPSPSLRTHHDYGSKPVFPTYSWPIQALLLPGGEDLVRHSKSVRASGCRSHFQSHTHSGKAPWKEEFCVCAAMGEKDSPEARLTINRIWIRSQTGLLPVSGPLPLLSLNVQFKQSHSFPMLTLLRCRVKDNHNTRKTTTTTTRKMPRALWFKQRQVPVCCSLLILQSAVYAADNLGTWLLQVSLSHQSRAAPPLHPCCPVAQASRHSPCPTVPLVVSTQIHEVLTKSQAHAACFMSVLSFNSLRYPMRCVPLLFPPYKRGSRGSGS